MMYIVFYRLITGYRMGGVNCEVAKECEEVNSKQISYMTLIGSHAPQARSCIHTKCTFHCPSAGHLDHTCPDHDVLVRKLLLEA